MMCAIHKDNRKKVMRNEGNFLVQNQNKLLGACRKPGVVTVKNDKYIIILASVNAGEYYSGSYDDDRKIRVIDVENDLLRMSDITSP